MGRIPRQCDFMAGWDSGYTRPPRKENQKIRLGGAHGLTSKSGGFKGLKTWNISAQVSRVAGVESKGRSGAFTEYIERDKECVVAYGDTGQEGKKKYAELEEKLLKQKKNSVIQRRFVIPLPKEILNSPPKVEKLLKTLQTRYFSSCYAFSAALHKSENFKNPHVHIAYSNVDANFKAIREFRDPAMLDSVKKDIKNFIEHELKIKCQMKGIGKSIKHYPKWIAGALKRAQEAEKRGDGGKMMKEYAEKYPAFNEYISERNRKYTERAIQLKEGKLKKTTEAEAMCIEEFSEKIKKRAGGFLGKFYSKKEKEQIKQDIAHNERIIDNLKKNNENLNFNPEVFKMNEETKKTEIETESAGKRTYDAVYQDGKFYDLHDPKNLYGLEKELKIETYDEDVKNLKNADFVKLRIPDCMLPDLKDVIYNTELAQKESFTYEVEKMSEEEQKRKQQYLHNLQEYLEKKKQEPKKDAFAEDLERRLNKSKSRGFGR
ncbi:MAG: hypothetical protein ACYDDB_04185 [bacterium]